jgi:hypothetical protein
MPNLVIGFQVCGTQPLVNVAQMRGTAGLVAPMRPISDCIVLQDELILLNVHVALSRELSGPC